ncbi:hypothetical protein ILYODFUR_035395 [Ilyodon furcidens]|uniref:Uncharacterized protein n=1 Tax=Ilyodon furcidens TaxID=33524 RepID=A0ABV0TR89_9TELE
MTYHLFRPVMSTNNIQTAGLSVSFPHTAVALQSSHCSKALSPSGNLAAKDSQETLAKEQNISCDVSGPVKAICFLLPKVRGQDAETCASMHAPTYTHLTSADAVPLGNSTCAFHFFLRVSLSCLIIYNTFCVLFFSSVCWLLFPNI